MATNGKLGDNHRQEAVRSRSQTFNHQIEQWVIRNSNNGQFIAVKQDGSPFKGVRKEGKCGC